MMKDNIEKSNYIIPISSQSIFLKFECDNHVYVPEFSSIFRTICLDRIFSEGRFYRRVDDWEEDKL